MRVKAVVAFGFASALLGACEQSAAPTTPQIRPVRAVTVEHRVISEPVIFFGQIKARDEMNLAFRVDGKLVDRMVSPGDPISVGQVVARLDAQNEQNALQAADADIAAAKAALTHAEKLEARQTDLLKRGVTSRALYDQALQQLQAAQAQLESAQARRRTAESRVNHAELVADFAGIVTAKGAEPGEFVRAGQMIVRVAPIDRMDAVFEVPAQLGLLRRIPYNPIVEIALTDTPNVKTKGRIREISPQPDPATRLFPVKIGLDESPEGFFFGAAVTGRVSLESQPIMTVPATALIEADGRPSVWVVDPASNMVALRAIEITRYDASVVVVSSGLRDGELVVTAGVNVLYPGQKVKLLSGPS
jgi:membrane fusion protein, multidrug efflux system